MGEAHSLNHLNHCYKITPNCLMADIYISVDAETLDITGPIISLHHKDEPAFASNTIPVMKKVVHIFVNYAQQIHREGNLDVSYENCFKACLSKQINDHTICKLSTFGTQIYGCNSPFNDTSGTYPFYLAPDLMHQKKPNQNII